MKILHVIPDLGYSGAAKQLTLLAPGLLREPFDVRVCLLGKEGPWAKNLRQAGVPVDSLRWTRLVQPQALWRLRGLIRDLRPDVIHAWRMPAARALAVARGRCRLFVSDALPSRARGPELNRLDRWLLGRADRLLAGTQAEAAHYRRLGVSPDAIRLVPPGVACRDPGGPDRAEVCRVLGVPEDARLLVGIGPLEPAKRFLDAVWAFDILQYLYAALHLVLVGAGSDRDRLQNFSRHIGAPDRVHCVGLVEDVAAVLTQAEVVWVPSLGPSGINVALEAMAAGRPVVANRVGGLPEIVVEGETGLLVPPGDKAALARQTRLLLEDQDQRRRLGEAGRKRARQQFAAAALVDRMTELYREVLA